MNSAVDSTAEVLHGLAAAVRQRRASLPPRAGAGCAAAPAS